MTDWNEIRVRYIAGNMSLKQLAAESGVSYSRITKHASTEKWAAQRKAFGKKAADKAIQRASARAQANLEKAIIVTEGLLDVSVKALEDRDQFRRHLVVRKVNGSEETTEEVFRKVDTKALKELTDAVEKLSMLLRDLLGEPDAEGKLRRETEKLKQEKLRTEIRKLNEERERNEEEQKEAGEPFIMRFETEEEYLARTGSTEAEREAEDLPE